MSKYWVNSNSGDYIEDRNGIYYLHLIPATRNGEYHTSNIVKLTQVQFETIRGFIPIKYKKLMSRLSSFNHPYRPTLKSGEKGYTEQTIIPTIEDSRDIRLKELGL